MFYSTQQCQEKGGEITSWSPQAAVKIRKSKQVKGKKGRSLNFSEREKGCWWVGNKEARKRKHRRRICSVWKMWEPSTQMLQKKAIEKLNGTCIGLQLGACLSMLLNGDLNEREESKK